MVEIVEIYFMIINVLKCFKYIILLSLLIFLLQLLFAFLHNVLVKYTFYSIKIVKKDIIKKYMQYKYSFFIKERNFFELKNFPKKSKL